MKRLMGLIALVASLAFAGATLAQDKPAATPDKPAAAAEAAKPAAEPAKPTVAKADTVWMMVATAFVLFMVPGLALFYGGMVRSKNALSVMMQVLVTFCLIGVIWVIYGYSLAFTSGNAFFGGFSKMFLSGVTGDSLGATFSKGVAIPELIFVVFQLTFAGLTCALVVGSFAERMKFSAALVFAVLWFTFAYAPMAHMVWYWDGPDAITDAKEPRGGHSGGRLAVAKGRTRLCRRHGRSHQRWRRRPDGCLRARQAPGIRQGSHATA
jgi:Amt family ammonium transporter